MKIIVASIVCAFIAGCTTKPLQEQVVPSPAARDARSDSPQGRYTEQELWQGVAIEKLPLDNLELIVNFEPPYSAGIPGREYMMPHRVGIGLRNIGRNKIDDLDVSLIFTHKTAVTYLRLPNGTTLKFRMDRGYRGVNLTYTFIQPGEETWFFLHRPLWSWFPVVTSSDDGIYEFWWEVGAHSSERLTLRKHGQDIRPEGSTEQSGAAYRR